MAYIRNTQPYLELCVVVVFFCVCVCVWGGGGGCKKCWVRQRTGKFGKISLMI